MSGGLQGLDPQDCLDLVNALKDSAHQLNRTGAQLNQTIARAGWQGPDSQRFRSQWPGNRTILNHTAQNLELAAMALLREIAEQERASAVDGGGGPLAELIDGAKDLWEDITDGVGNVFDDVKDGLDWLGQEILANPVVHANLNFYGNLGYLAAIPIAALINGPPSLISVLASLGLVAGSGVDAVTTTLTGGLVNPKFFDDGMVEVGGPQAVTNSSESSLTQPTSVADIFDSVLSAYEATDSNGDPTAGVRIVSVRQPDGTYAYIVNIPGTESNTANSNNNPLDYTSNVRLASGQSSAASRAVAEAMARAGIPPEAPVMLVGHSQGGMIAQELATDPSFTGQYNLTTVLTAGSPTQPYAIDPNINYLAIAHPADIVPMFDGGGTMSDLTTYQQAPNVHVVPTDNPPFSGPIGDFIPAMHDQNTYRQDLTQLGKYPDIGRFENDPSTQVFITDDPSRVSAVDIDFSRK
ncbi:PGAP1-like alpha/beta domain-containing protein [Arthrobacter sp. AQ5-05]|uniref:PGAP1-like alpha/beta domain-containing protein n=1 Tax=Arthrobacter sp. AQ5-05 TaxID=2184581 RepID=UPI0012B64EC9|nr:hypothetical protein [Arthrobacter sp. AQ5-05]